MDHITNDSYNDDEPIVIQHKSTDRIDSLYADIYQIEERLGTTKNGSKIIYFRLNDKWNSLCRMVLWLSNAFWSPYCYVIKRN